MDAPQGLTRRALTLLAVFGFYLAATQLFPFVAPPPANVALLWLPNAVAAVALLHLPVSAWWQVYLVCIAAEIAGDAFVGIPVWAALLFGLVNVVEATVFVLVARLIASQPDPSLLSERGAFSLGAAAITVPAFTGLAGASVSAAVFGGPYLSAWQHWWLGDALGLLVGVAAGQALLTRSSSVAGQRSRLVSVFAAAGSLLLLVAAVQLFEAGYYTSAMYAIISSAIVAATAFGAVGAGIATLLLTIAALLVTASAAAESSVIETKFLLLMLVVVVYGVAAATESLHGRNQRLIRSETQQRLQAGELRDALAELQASESRFRLLARIGESLAVAGPNQQIVLDAATSELASHLGDASVVALTDQRRGLLIPMSFRHTDPAGQAALAETLKQPTEVGKGLAGSVASTGQPVLLNNTPAPLVRESVPSHYQPYVDRFGISATMIAPLVVEGSVIGTVGVIRHDAGRPYTDTDLSVLTEVARRLSLAVQQARLHEQLADTLRRSDEDLSRFVYIASHGLQAPLREARGFSDVLQHLMPAEHLSASQQDAVRHVIASISRMENTIRDLIKFTRIPSAAAQVSEVSIRQSCQQALESVTDLARATNATVICRSEERVLSDPGLLRQAFAVVLDNSMRYARPHTTPRIEVTSHRNDDGTTAISLTDNGPGVDPRYRERVFELFQQLGKGSGTGAGLAIAKRIVQSQHGTITLHSDGVHGTTVTITLPSPPMAPPPPAAR